MSRRAPGAAEAVAFLRALAGHLSTASLYGPEHRASEGALEAAWEALGRLFEAEPRPVFSFLEREVAFGDLPLEELRRWAWAARFTEAGVQRVEMEAEADREEFLGFVAELANALELHPEPLEEPPHPHIRVGSLGLRGTVAETADVRVSAAPGGEDAPPRRLSEPSEAVKWIHEVAGEGGPVAATEAAAVVRELLVAMHDTRRLVTPLVPMGESREFMAAHPLNVSILAMGMAEHLRLSPREVQRIGEAALLHDIGRSLAGGGGAGGGDGEGAPTEADGAPTETDGAPSDADEASTEGAPSEAERERVRRHPVEGARMLLQASSGHALSAVVAYEHHMHWDGEGGYPAPHYPRRPHRFSRLVQVCDVYDTLRSPRPFRPALTAEAALRFMEERAGSQLDPDLVTAFADMVRHWEPEREEEGEGAPLLGVDELHRLPAGPFDADLEARPA